MKYIIYVFTQGLKDFMQEGREEDWSGCEAYKIHSKITVTNREMFPVRAIARLLEI